MIKKIDKKELFTRLSFFSRSKTSLLNAFFEQVVNGQKLQLVFTPNPEQLIQARHDEDFFNVLTQADYLLPDGIGLIWALRFLQHKTWFKAGKKQAFRHQNTTFNSPTERRSPIERLAGVEVAEALIIKARKQDWKVLVIGGRDYDQFLNFWTDKVRWLAGYEKVQQPTNLEERRAEQAIKDFKPDILFTAFGAPHQEKWLVEHRFLLEKAGVKLAMAAGGAFDMLAGKLKRAPGWMRKLGLEWLFRLAQEPSRWKRQLRLVEFVGWVIS